MLFDLQVLCMNATEFEEHLENEGWMENEEDESESLSFSESIPETQWLWCDNMEDCIIVSTNILPAQKWNVNCVTSAFISVFQVQFKN